MLPRSSGRAAIVDGYDGPASGRYTGRYIGRYNGRVRPGTELPQLDLRARDELITLEIVKFALERRAGLC